MMKANDASLSTPLPGESISNSETVWYTVPITKKVEETKTNWDEDRVANNTDDESLNASLSETSFSDGPIGHHHHQQKSSHYKHKPTFQSIRLWLKKRKTKFMASLDSEMEGSNYSVASSSARSLAQDSLTSETGGLMRNKHGSIACTFLV